MEAIQNSPVSSDWVQAHFQLTPNYKTIPNYPGPILFMQGEIDAQTPLPDLYLCLDELKKHNRHNITVKTFANLGHGFSPNIGTNQIQPTIGPIESIAMETLKEWFEINQ